MSADPKIAHVRIDNIKEDLKDSLSKESYCECYFCGKIIHLTGEFVDLLERLTGIYYHCPFCVRHGFHQKRSKDVLIMSFRGIIGYYYYGVFLKEYSPAIYLSDIHSMIRSHQAAGSINPVFMYDPDTFLWFVDFSKVGKGKKKIGIEHVLKTVINILACFNLGKIVVGFKTSTLYQKYEEAILKWYELRQRPKGVYFLSPSLIGCSATITGGTSSNGYSFSIEETRDFLPQELRPI